MAHVFSERISDVILSSGRRSVELTLNDLRRELAEGGTVQASSVSSTLRSHLVIEGNYQPPSLGSVACVDRNGIRVLVLYETKNRLKWKDELGFVGSFLGPTLQLDQRNASEILSLTIYYVFLCQIAKQTFQMQ